MVLTLVAETKYEVFGGYLVRYCPKQTSRGLKESAEVSLSIRLLDEKLIHPVSPMWPECVSDATNQRKLLCSAPCRTHCCTDRLRRRRRHVEASWIFLNAVCVYLKCYLSWHFYEVLRKQAATYETMVTSPSLAIVGSVSDNMTCDVSFDMLDFLNINGKCRWQGMRWIMGYVGAV